MTLNSHQLPPLVSSHGSVKAWCVTRLLHDTTTEEMEQPAFDELNFLDGYNLRLDVATKNNFEENSKLWGNVVLDFAVNFSFITPMPNNKYKVFLKVGGGWTGRIDTSGPPIPTPWQNSSVLWTTHVLDGPLYPKRSTGFWARICPIIVGRTTNNNPFWGVWSGRFFNGNTTLRAVVL